MKIFMCLFFINFVLTCIVCMYTEVNDLLVTPHLTVARDCPGSISPKDEINLEVGTELVLNCTVEQTCKYITNNKFWIFYGNKVTSRYVDKKYVKNNFQLRIPSLDINNSGTYTCLVATSNQSLASIYQQSVASIYQQSVTVDTINVKVLYFPLTNASIKCTSDNLKTLNCVWTDENTNVKDQNKEWNLTYDFNNSQYACSKIGSPNDNTCQIQGDRYPSNMPVSIFKLTASNALGDNTTSFPVDLYKNVILRPPKFDDVQEIGARSAIIIWKPQRYNKSWNFNTTDQPHVFIEYMIEYKSEHDNRTNKTSSNNFALANLVPNSQYKVVLFARLVFDGYCNKWSEPINTMFRTNATIPDSWNALAIGSFTTEVESQNTRKLSVYWKALPKLKQNGDDFYYQISLSEKNLSHNANDTSYSFKNLSTDRDYTIVVKGVNVIGKSKDASSISVKRLTPSEDKTPDRPIMKDVVNFDNGKYYVEWVIKDNSSINVFWCEVSDKKTIPPKKCDNGGIMYTPAVLGQSNITLELNNSKTYRFAVASFAKNLSQGLVWNFCEIPKARQPISTVKNLSFSTSTNSITLTWNLPCENRFQEITGFNISYNNSTRNASDSTYRSIIVSQAKACKNKKSDCNFKITNLLASTKYSVTVALVTKNAEGEQVRQNVETKNVSSDSDVTATLIIVGTLIAVIAVITAVIYTYKKFFSDRLKLLKNLQLPQGLSEKTDDADWNINTQESSSVYIIKDESDKLQREKSSNSLYNSSGYASECALSTYSNHESDDQESVICLQINSSQKSGEITQQLECERNHYRKMFPSSLDDIGFNDQAAIDTDLDSFTAKESLDTSEKNLQSTETNDHPGKLRSTGYVRVLHEEHSDPKCEDKSHTKNLPRNTPPDFSPALELNIPATGLCDLGKKMQVNEEITIPSSSVVDITNQLLDSSGTKMSPVSQNYTKTFIVIPKEIEAQNIQNTVLKESQYVTTSFFTAEKPMNTKQEEHSASGYTKAFPVNHDINKKTATESKTSEQKPLSEKNYVKIFDLSSC